MLIQQMRELEAVGVVHREVTITMPSAVRS